MPNETYVHPAHIPVILFRAGTKGDRNYAYAVAFIAGGTAVRISGDQRFTLKSNTINRVREADIDGLIIPVAEGERIGLFTRLKGIRIAEREVGGISLFDDPRNTPLREVRAWYRIPNDVQIPEGLMLVKEERPHGRASHYLLGPAEDMTLLHFITMLTGLANDPRITEVQAHDHQ